MEISPAEDKLVGSGEAVTTKVSDITNKAVDICRICQSPEEPDNPLRHPCACRGSLKYIHSDCLFLWLNRRKRNHCEICKHRYSIVPVYSENAPERLPWHEFLMGLLMRALRFMNLMLPWVFMIPFNAYCSSFRPWDREGVFVNQTVFELSLKFPGLFYTAEIVSSTTDMVVQMEIIRVLLRRHPEFLRHMIILENGLKDIDVTGIVLLLANHLHILCDWWHDQLLHLPFLHIIQRGPLALAFVPRNTPLHQFGAIRRFFSLLSDNTFAVLAINIYWSFFNVLLPFSIGRVVLVLLRCFSLGWIAENATEVAAGDMVIRSVLLAFLASVFTLSRNTYLTRVRWFLPSVKDTFILCFKLVVLPWILGCWLDFCTFPILGKTASHSVEVLSDYPLMADKHWLMGMLYLVVALSCMELIQKIVPKRAFWYLLDVAEPNYKITKLHLGPILLAFAFHGAMVVIVLHLPIKTISLISQSFFPLQFGVYEDEFVLGLLVAYTGLIIFGPRWLANLIRPSIRPIVHKWVITVSSLLKLSDFLLGEPRKHRANRNVRVRPRFLVFGIAEGSMVSLYGSQSDTTCEKDTNDQRDKRFMLRIGVMLVLASLSMFLVSTTFMALPILVGRAFFHSISFFMLSFGLKHDDICAFWIGFCILRGIYITTCFVYDHLVTGKVHLLINHFMMFIRNVLLFSIWISVIPGLLGLLIDLMIIIPSQVPLNESPAFILLHDWLIGVVVLHIWIFLTMRTQINCFATVVWREKLQRIRSAGINGLPFTWLIRDVIGSIIVSLLFTLCVPYVVVNSLFPILGFSSAVNLTVQRFIWPAILALVPIWFSVKLISDLIIYLHQLEFDNRYKVGERLVDFTEDLE
ncbi:Zinc finger RING-CH-type [Arabidopsis thaliana x Arabidopsis arenosa]|uniref:Zinc finger RING-CH-type n=1 Tax=Arabidopsis thaliana x Arabidopsis arenosa TaxID=1240361 RepID=A0A8T1Y234_9BRAS|nr:Zinc finger RING-CH-type [Arabidopsis thaliana x Arabidopsis arenosa]